MQVAPSKPPPLQFLAGEFVISAGCVLFRHNPDSPSNGLEVCILRHLDKDQYTLPKGRKDRGETIEAAAARETFEETGYKCSLWPNRIPTRAPAPGVNNVHTVEVVDNLVEPIAVTIRQPDGKVIFWYIALVEEGVEKQEGTQMESENYKSEFLAVNRALDILTSQSDREIVKKAYDIVVQKGRL
ncbi:hypothetical protein NLJ89_g6817 [Agrocybe chaxingu]|uniref:Nudix hydrolase domain-containing protein n=1 Tax=Agrocybe chaxingu TaxID=84603 RepID=A0A9W8MUA1_9AGAR|nr:hypothetical protein NLJ89_g6817 [Agrocybe chaxingu]